MSVQTFNVVGGMWLLGIFLSILGFTYAYTFKPSVTLKIVREVLGAILCVIHMVLILYTGSLLHMNEILTWVIVGGIFVGDRIAINMLMANKINRKALSAVIVVEFFTCTIFLVKLFTLN